MSVFPRSAAERRKARAVQLAALLDDAQRRSQRLGRSVKCGEGGDHYRNDPTYGPLGCQNDGSTCLCECHDPVPEAGCG